MANGIPDGGCFVTAVHHAVGALLVIPGSVRVPIRLFHQRAKGFRIAFAQQVAGTLPSEDVSGRVAPRRAAVTAVAGEEVEKQARLAERPCACAATSTEDRAEKFFGSRSREEVRLVRRTL